MHLVTSPGPSKGSTGVGLPDPQSRALGFQCRAADETWFAKVLLVFTHYIPSKRGPQPALFVRWYCAAPATQLTSLASMQRLQWETARHPDSTAIIPRCDVISARSVLEPVLIQQEPNSQDHLNHFIRVGGR